LLLPHLQNDGSHLPKLDYGRTPTVTTIVKVFDATLALE
jgi:hypothetical protein